MSKLFANQSNRFILRRVLHDTMFGRIYTASDKLTGEMVVIKISFLNLMSKGVARRGSQVLENPREECRVMELLGGRKHVLGLVTEFQNKDFHWAVFPYCPNGDFYDFVTLVGRFTPCRARFFFKQLLEAVTHVHETGFAHLDLSLENLLRDKDGDLQLCDFGVVQTLPQNSHFCPLGGCRPGKLKYMAPELSHGSEMNPVKADVYSMGIILFMMLAGKSPYRRQDVNDENFIALHVNGSKNVLEHNGVFLCEPLTELLDGMLQLNPKKRFDIQDVTNCKWLCPPLVDR